METENIKICHVTSVHNWDDIRIFKKQCTSLAKHFNHVYLVAPNAPTKNIDNVNVVGVSFKEIKNRRKRILTLRKMIFQKALELNADVYHLHDPELLTFVKKLKKLGKKVIFDSHEDVPFDILDKDWLKYQFVKNAVSKTYNRFEKKTCKKADGLISVLPSITSKFQTPIKETIYNYPIINTTNTISEPKPDNSQKTIIYNGGLTRIRGIKEACIALNKLDSSKFKLQLLGPWESESFRLECLTEVDDKNKIEYLGNVDFELCQEHLLKADIGIILFHKIANHINSLPNKSFEFILNNLPMLISDIPFWKNEFDECATFADPLNPDEIIDKLHYIYDNYSEISKKTAIYREKVINDKSWQSQEEKLISFYKKIIA